MASLVFLVLVSTRTATSSTALLAPQGAPTDNVVTRVGYAPTACPQMNCLRDTRAQQRVKRRLFPRSGHQIYRDVAVWSRALRYTFVTS